ncbi:MAG: RNA-binding domain-containing protein [Bacteroidales bacterium]
MEIPINIDDLLSGKVIESNRIEFKEGWNPDPIYRTICAFANDFDNTGGGYILIGIEDVKIRSGNLIKGIDPALIADIQEKMIGFNNLIRPVYHPKFYIETIGSKQMIVLWIPGGPNRPYEVPDEVTKGRIAYNYRIRRYSSSVIPSVHEKNELLSLANQVPFDDRPNTNANTDDISPVLVEEYLKTVKSKLSGIFKKTSFEEILSGMELLSGPSESRFPRNIALMLFNELPKKFFPYSRIEIVHFYDDADSDEFNEIPPISGPVHKQIFKALDYLKTNIILEKVKKRPGKSESLRFWNYPYQALEEAVANAVYHRDYSVREPVEIRIYPDSLVILNYGGPDRSIRMESFKAGIIKARRYRNRRLGDFLKELHLTEGKATGIPTIKKSLHDNGSPEAYFETDDERTYFMIEFKIHPAFRNTLIPWMLLNPAGLNDIDNLIDWIIDNYSINKTNHTVDVEISDSDTSGNQVSNQVTDHGARKSIEVSNEVNILINSFIESFEDNNIDKSTDVNNKAGSDVSNHVTDEISETFKKVLSERTLEIFKVCREPISLGSLFEKLGISKQTKNVNFYIRPLLRRNWIEMTDPINPKSRNQKYFTSMRGEMILKLYNFFKNEILGK